jgi:hypothetical protein
MERLGVKIFRNNVDFLNQVLYHAEQLCAQVPSWRVCGSSRRKQSEYEMEDRFMKNWAGLVTLVLALTACGKSLQMKAKPEEKETAGSTGGGKAGDTTGGTGQTTGGTGQTTGGTGQTTGGTGQTSR